ncbi:hypothetical protein K435DRAFT_854564 [Dendrothele bispora CBS 962.96]|uniref:Uncharacterized protein n=1 Tax=Dendrothele bispora (strain CBS 962.96) TaxID=1314807 RepID=A0A4S8MDK6_DENBC|nr:hypothetical protein K435DRAFT_854564 [Dendrothele bispora CBS 962.96]
MSSKREAPEPCFVSSKRLRVHCNGGHQSVKVEKSEGHAQDVQAVKQEVTLADSGENHTTESGYRDGTPSDGGENHTTENEYRARTPSEDGNFDYDEGEDRSQRSSEIQFAKFLKFEDSVTTWVDSVEGAEYVEESVAKDYRDVAVQTGSPAGALGSGEVTLIASEKSYGDLESEVALAHQAASAAWNKYWDAEEKRLELENVADAYKMGRDRAIEHLRQTIDEKNKLETEVRYWRKTVRQIGEKMVEWSDKTMNFAYAKGANKQGDGNT